MTCRCASTASRAAASCRLQPRGIGGPRALPVKRVCDLSRKASYNRFVAGVDARGGSLLLSAAQDALPRASHSPRTMSAYSDAGVILTDLADAADAIGRRFPLSLAAKGSSDDRRARFDQRPGRYQVLRFGPMRSIVALDRGSAADGAFFAPVALRKDNAVLNLRHCSAGRKDNAWASSPRNHCGTGAGESARAQAPWMVSRHPNRRLTLLPRSNAHGRAPKFESRAGGRKLRGWCCGTPSRAIPFSAASLERSRRIGRTIWRADPAAALETALANSLKRAWPRTRRNRR